MKLREMRQLCERLDGVQREYLIRSYHMKVDEPSVYKRYSPATAKEISALERQMGMSCPPSYRMFLAIQNGWRRFALGWSLLGAPRAESRDLHETVRQTLGQSGVVATKEEQRQLLEKEKKDPRVIHPRHHWIIGTDANYNLLLFDRNRVARNGEPEVVSSRYIIHVECRWKNFETFVRHALRRVEKRVRELRALAAKEEQALGGAPARTARGMARRPGGGVQMAKRVATRRR